MDDLFGAAQAQNQMMQQQNMMQQGMAQQPNMMMQQPDMMSQQNMMMQQQGMMQQQYPMNYGQQMPMYGNDMYGQMQSGYQMGRVDALGFTHYSRGQVLQGLRDYVVRMTGVGVTKEEKLDDYVNGNLRHCCPYCKTIITMLPVMYFNLPEAGMQVPFYFCTDCGKLFYPRDFM